MADKTRAELDEEESNFARYCERFPAKKVTSRGEPFWNKHPAKDYLAADVESGLAYELKPTALRDTRKEYQEFTLHTFRKHVHQEKEKQRSKPYWRHKRNIQATIELARERMGQKYNWIQMRTQAEIDQATSMLDRMNL